MKIGDKFHSDINGGIEVTVVDTYYCGEHGNTERTLLICVGNGLLLKFSETTIYRAGDTIIESPKYEGCIELIENLKEYE